MSFWRSRDGLLFGCFLVALGALVYAVYTASSSTTAFERRICDRTNQLDRTIVATLDRSAKALPTNAYYKSRPAELERQQRNIARAIREFRGDVC